MMNPHWLELPLSRTNFHGPKGVRAIEVRLYNNVCSYGIFSKGLKNEYETAVVNEPSVFEPLKFYCITKIGTANHNK